MVPIASFIRLLRGFLAAALALGCIALALTARADNPFDAKQRENAARVSRAGRAPDGAVPLLELWRNWDNATPAATMRLLERLATDRRLSPARRVYVRTLLARAALRMGDPEAAGRAVRELGYLTTFRVVGPFDNEGKAGFENAMPPEQQTQSSQENVAWPGKERSVTWRSYPDVGRLGYVNFDSVFRPNTNACGFAETMVRSERNQPITLWVGAGGAFKVWWNGEEVLRDAGYRHPDPDRSVASVAAHEGLNRLLIKVCVAEASWGFFLRLGDADGGPANGIAADESAPREVAASETRPTARTRALKSDFEQLGTAAAGESASAAALENFARFLVYTGADDPAERRAPDLAARAAEKEPNLARLRLAATLAEQRGEAMRFVVRAKELAPDQPETLLLEAIVRQGGPSPEDALPLLEQLREGTPRIEGALLRANIVRDLGLVETAAHIVKGALDEAPGAPTLLRAYAESLEGADRSDSAIEARRAAVAARYDDGGSRRVLAADALYRGDADTVREHIAAMRAANPDDDGTLLYAASMYEALGRPEEANEAYQAARSLAPEDAALLVAHGQFLLRQGQASEATTMLRRAMELRPQDAETRELLEHIRPEGRVDEQYAIDARAILARRVRGRGYPITVLQDLTVNTVFNNGLGSSFRQVAVQIHDAEGARRWRTYSIQFDPDAQRVDIRLARVYREGRVLEAMQTFERPLGEPWYRVYYDTRALVVAFPDLEPGDTVELRYRLDNVAHTNLFADYYGDLAFLQDFEPSRNVEYVLITPPTREFFFNEPHLSGLNHTRQVTAERRVDRWVATDVPAVREEDRMPGRTAVTPYLHVSTYRTWQDVGRWYWGLIKDQLYADESLKRTVRELVANAPDVRTKVTRIHNWVVRNTRYVALEFGIHGYKPYRVPQIVQRGFGDCKDKASLLYTMLREAGVDARIVLVRTRRNGTIMDLPASLAIFDHAIAYVPELDLYLDGTAEHSGTTELPSQDQGVTVLVVGPDSAAELRRTPVLPAERNRRTREMDVRLAADGSAEVRVEEEVRGDDAAYFRRTFQAQGTRQERLEASLRQTFPGLELVSQTFGELGDLERPVTYNYQARIPQMARRDGAELRIAPAVLDDLVRSLARTPSRRYALDLGGTSAYVEERTLHVPEAMRVVRSPEGGEITGPFGRLALTVQNEGGRIQIRTEFELTRDLIPAEEYAAFRAWIDRGDALLRQRIVLAPSGAAGEGR